MASQDVADELKLLVNILDRISKCPDGIRPDHLKPVMDRLTLASEKLHKMEVPSKPRTAKEEHSNRISSSHSIANAESSCLGNSFKANRSSVFSSSGFPSAKPVVTKPSSVKAIPIPRNKPASDSVKISKEVGQCLTSTLYNVVEGTTALLRAATCSIFIRQEDEMVSIVNVAKKLTFPPQLVRHRCVGSSDAEVLGSGIALNQRVSDGSQSTAAMLIFPIYAMSNTHERKGQAVAVIHVENKLQGMASFDEMDESMLYFSSCLIGEIMARVPQMDWINNFYDPITQHIVCPFKPAMILTLPSVCKSAMNRSESSGAGRRERRATVHAPSTSTLSTENTKDGSSPLSSSIISDIENCITKLLIKRESLPETAKQPTVGMVQMPTLREVRSFLDNIEECWKESVTASVALTESDREVQMEVRQLRFALEEAQKQNRTAIEKLRLYELGTGDYKQEYKEMKSEFEAYLRKQENLDI